MDERIFRSTAERLAASGGWTCPLVSRESGEAERLQAGAVSAIAGVLALLRRVTESRRGGDSRESRLRHLAAWFAGAASNEAAHALFAATFDLGTPRHVALSILTPS